MQKKVTIYLSEEDYRKFKILCAETDKSYGEFVSEWLGKEKKK